MLNVNYAYAMLMNFEEPRTIREVINMPYLDSWLDTMKEKMKSLEKNETWDLVTLPKGRNLIGCKWVFKKNYSIDGNINKYKERLVTKGYSKKKGIDHGEFFSLV